MWPCMGGGGKCGHGRVGVSVAMGGWGYVWPWEGGGKCGHGRVGVSVAWEGGGKCGMGDACIMHMYTYVDLLLDVTHVNLCVSIAL